MGERRLAAIMFMDMVGYTMLGQKNESLSLALVEQQRKLVRPIFSTYKGREVKTMGDAILIEFPNALDAVRCAYEIQRASRDSNISSGMENRMSLRIGIHLGDIVETNGDIMGDAVNIASRVEPLAEEGGVCLTRQVYDQVHNKFEYPITSIGVRTVKHVKTPLEVYKMVMPWEEGKTTLSTQSKNKRIAVLPFSNMSPDPHDEYFADGLTEELISTISKMGGLDVIARTSVMKYKSGTKGVDEIGRELNVGAILEGSVRKAANRLRITAQVVDVRSQGHLWAQSYDRELKDVFEVQSEIAKEVAHALKIQMLPRRVLPRPRRPTTSTVAFTLYLKGRYHWNTRSDEGLNRSIALFDEAISRDSQYAPAYAGLSDCYTMLGVYGYRRPATVFPRARELVAKTLAIDDNLPEAHASMFEILAHYDFDWATAESEIERALALNPSYAQAHSWRGSCYLASHGRFEEALVEMRKAEELDPLSMIIATETGKVLHFARKHDSAIEQYQKSLEIDPHFPIAHKGLAEAYASMAMYDEATAEIEKAIELSRRSVFILDDLGYIYAVSGRKDKAQEVVAELERISKDEYVTPYGLAAIYSGLGEIDVAFEWLEKAYEDRSFLTWLNVDPAFDSMRNDSRFRSIIKRLGLG